MTDRNRKLLYMTRSREKYKKLFEMACAYFNDIDHDKDANYSKHFKKKLKAKEN